MPKTTPYQLLNALRPKEMDALRRDISERGVLVPVEVDDDGNVLDGHHRVLIAEELGIRYRKVVRTFESEEDKFEHALKLNLLRRHLGPVAWAGAFQKLCRVRGVRLGSGSQKRNGNRKSNGQETATVAALAKELGVPARTARWRLRLAQDLKGHRDLIQKVDAGEVEAKTAKREARTRNARKEAKKRRLSSCRGRSGSNAPTSGT